MSRQTHITYCQQSLMYLYPENKNPSLLKLGIPTSA